MVTTVLGSIFSTPPVHVRAADSTWTQTDWSGGASSSTATGTVTTYSAVSNTDPTSSAGNLTLSVTSGWYNTSWKYRRKITFDNSTTNLGVTTEAHTNFPVLVKLTSSTIDYSNTQDSGQDLRFADSDGTTLLSYEIEKWDESGTSYVWVKVPQIDASDIDYIYMYYGNSSASDGQAATSVWDSNYKDVYHMKESSGTTVADSTSSAVNGTKVSASEPAVTTAGQIGNAQTFDGTDDYLTMSSSSHLPSGSGARTFSAWIKPTSTTARGFILSYGDGSDNQKNDVEINGFVAGHNGKLILHTWNSGVTTTSTDIGTGSWIHVAISYSSGTLQNGTKIYVNGALKTTQALSDTGGGWSITPDTQATNFMIGRRSATSAYFPGSMDEIRISNAVRSTAYIAAEYKTATDDFNTFGSQEERYVSSGTLTSVVFDAVYSVTWGTLSYNASGSTVSVKARTSTSSTMSGATAFSSCSAITSGADISSNSCITDGQRYIQYQITLTPSSANTPTFQDITIAYQLPDTAAPDNPSSVTATSSNGGSTITTNTWYNHNSPYFTWTEPADNANSGETATGIAGYYVYFGTDSTANPQTAGTFQTTRMYTASSLSTGSTYYLRMKTKDNTDNITSSAVTLFTYKYDATVPNNPAFVSVSPSGYSSTNSYTFIWPSTGSNAASDTSSGLAGYQYKTGASSGSYSTYSSTTTNTEVSLTNAAYQDGANVFFLRTVDTAGNTSSPIQVTFYYNASAPTAPQGLTATPSSGTTNSFAFSWSAPATYQGSASELTYLYSINTAPTAATVTSNGSSTSLAAGAYATQQGANTFYVVAKDAAGNVNYSAYASVTFTATTSAPGQPLNVTIADSSSRAAATYRLSLTWNKPSSGGTVSQYEIVRSTDNSNFSRVGTTTSTGYIDSDLSTDTTYYYIIRAKDNAGATSADSATVSKKPTGRYSDPPKLTVNPTVTAGATSASITWTTDRESDSFVEYGTTTNYGSNFGLREEKTTHKVELTGLVPGTVYHYRVQSLDPGDLRDYDSSKGKSNDFSFETGAAPALSNVSFSDITTNSAILSFDTNKASSAVIEYGTSTNYGSSVTDESGSGTTKHTVRLKDLTDGTTYQLKITINDSDGNKLTSTGHAFTTIAKPRISNVRFEPIVGEARPGAKISWETNVPTSAAVRISSDQGETSEMASSELKTSHEFAVKDKLADQRTYSFVPQSRDQFGNLAIGDTQRLQTPQDSRPPKLSDLVVQVKSAGTTVGSDQKSAQLVVTWTTDEPATSQVKYGRGISGANYEFTSQRDANLTEFHTVIISGLDASALYHLVPVSQDASGNEGTSNDTTVITGKPTNNVIDIILDTLQKTLSFTAIFKFIR